MMVDGNSRLSKICLRCDCRFHRNLCLVDDVGMRMSILISGATDSNQPAFQDPMVIDDDDGLGNRLACFPPYIYITL